MGDFVVGYVLYTHTLQHRMKCTYLPSEVGCDVVDVDTGVVVDATVVLTVSKKLKRERLEGTFIKWTQTTGSRNRKTSHLIA